VTSSLTIIEPIAAFGTHFGERVTQNPAGGLKRANVDVLQINLGKRCNQACHHCHVDAGPKRQEEMDKKTAERLMQLLAASPQTHTLDITGGAPELNANFRYLVQAARQLGKKVIDRSNLSILFEPGQETLARFLAEQQVEITASLPCYSQENVDKQRGKGVFDKSIRGLQMLNKLGYGQEGSGLELHLVYNPGGAFLPPAQAQLELAYKDKLLEDFGIVFNNLFTITNLPISRFRKSLERGGQLSSYMQLLEENYNEGTLENLMCRFQISVGWQGHLYDCDFNQMLDIPTSTVSAARPTIWDIESLGDLNRGNIAVENHCYGCTAGAGSSCGGSLS
jgi:radical SAM/Cys-rich protein